MHDLPLVAAHDFVDVADHHVLQGAWVADVGDPRGELRVPDYMVSVIETLMETLIERTKSVAADLLVVLHRIVDLLISYPHSGGSYQVVRLAPVVTALVC